MSSQEKSMVSKAITAFHSLLGRCPWKPPVVEAEKLPNTSHQAIYTDYAAI
jgi:hypothetical protein